ncbi:MAG: hypothetical protein HYZ75_02975 [Elusimicrobia bacterium]|nr:hypothetical protein [Elusimicrobiota bacterium]
MILLLTAVGAAALGGLAAYVLFFSALKAADPADLARRLAKVEARLDRLEHDV